MAKSNKQSKPAVPAKAADTVVRSFKLGKQKYTPRVEHNEVAWHKVQTCLTKGKGVATHAALASALAQHFSKVNAKGDPEDHINFISYMTRRGSLVEVS